MGVLNFWLLPLTARFQDRLKIQVFDTDHSIQAVDLEMQISQACSGSGSIPKSLPASFLARQ